MMNPQENNLESYLETGNLYDVTDPSIVEICKSFTDSSLSETDLIRQIFEYAREKVRHTFDTEEQTVPCSAMEVIAANHGICCAKANLFAALLRHCSIPVGFCYQKLRFRNQEGFFLHGLNAVYLREHEKWIRLDTGGGLMGLHDPFSVDRDTLGYIADPSKGEIDHPTIFAKPNSTVISIMKDSKDRKALWESWDLAIPAVFGEKQ